VTVKILQFPSRSHFDRRRPENRLKRVTMEAEQLEERQVDYWLSLADAAFNNSQERPKEKKKRRKNKNEGAA
jgi:hypothetical protein